ncbi:MAG: hypothetical protein JO219_10445 [Candidatus Eremiobacteraeota bacterium]|nr:hypothetical protein [Candidatus Eremiobacteraeota bacterium]MBV8365994.1 hypothetical protein [Candidatus Eremiobacteraeota bacterium]
MRKLHVAAFAAALFVAAGIAPSFADGTAVNDAAVNATIASGTATLATSGTQIAADFGSPPSGEIPILYNDHHVYANPSILKQNRTLAALVKNGVILVPLRSMFEEMGATVSYDAASKTATAQKPGASVQVTLGKNTAVINGEARPLDVPPEIYKGVLLVPVRVMSEALGAYVQWVPDRRITVVRYIPPTPVPTQPPTAPPPPPTLAPTPTPTPKPIVHRGFVEAGLRSGKTYNEYAAGQTDVGQSYVAAGAYEAGEWAFKVDWVQDTYNSTVNGVVPASVTGQPVCTPGFQGSPGAQPAGAGTTYFNTIDGGTCFTPPFKGRDSNVDVRLEYKIWKPANMYLLAAYGQDSFNSGFPSLHGWGGGLEILPRLDQDFTYYASVLDFPSNQGNYTVSDANSSNFGNVYRLQYNVVKYDVGVNWTFANPLYLYAGWGGDNQHGNSIVVSTCQPVGTGPNSVGCPPVPGTVFGHSHSGFYGGLGFKF